MRNASQLSGHVQESSNHRIKVVGTGTDPTNTNDTDTDTNDTETNTNLFAVSNVSFLPGDLILTCEAAAIGLDPPFRKTYCGYCGQRKQPMSLLSSSSSLWYDDDDDDDDDDWCTSCRMISICKKCRATGANAWHDEWGECHVLQSLRNAMHPLSVSDTDAATVNQPEREEPRLPPPGPSHHDDGKVEVEVQVESLPLLVIRLLFRHYFDRRVLLPRRNRKEQHPKQHCVWLPFLPNIPWDLYHDLYTADISIHSSPEEMRNYHHFTESICQRLRDDMVHKFQPPRGASASKKRSAECLDHDHLPQDTTHNKDKHHEHDQDHDKNACAGLLLEFVDWLDAAKVSDAVAKTVGCGHAITDLTLHMGAQCIGRALFLHHSFYNHACAPNAFFATDVDVDVDVDPHSFVQTTHTTNYKCNKEDGATATGNTKDWETNHHRKKHLPSLSASVYCISPIAKNEAVTISYIPTSGLDFRERQHRLQQSYHFQCDCLACRHAAENHNSNHNHNHNHNTSTAAAAIAVARRWEQAVFVPEGADLHSLRTLQYSCNEALVSIQDSRSTTDTEDGVLDLDQDRVSTSLEFELDHWIATIRMAQRGTRNQGLGPSHEICLENYRLLAWALTLRGRYVEATEEHRHFCHHVQPIRELFDPIALASQQVAWADTLAQAALGHPERIPHGNEQQLQQQQQQQQQLSTEQCQTAVEGARMALGPNHSLVRHLVQKTKQFAEVARNATGWEHASQAVGHPSNTRKP